LQTRKNLVAGSARPYGLLIGAARIKAGGLDSQGFSSYVAALLMLIVSAWACMRGGRSESTRRFVLQICLVLVLMLILAPVSWVHNYVLALLPCAVAIAAWFSLDTSGRERRALGFAAVAYAVGGTLSIFDAFAYIGAHFWGAFILWAALLRVLLNEPAEEKVPGDFAKAGATF